MSKSSKLIWEKPKKDFSNMPDHTHEIIIFTRANTLMVGRMINPKEFKANNNPGHINRDWIKRFTLTKPIIFKLN